MEDTKFQPARQNASRENEIISRTSYKGPVFTKTVITWSLIVRFGPTITQNAHDERGNLENTSGLRRRPGGPSNWAPKLDFLPLTVKEHHLPLLFRQVSESSGTPLEGNPRDCGDYKHYSVW